MAKQTERAQVLQIALPAPFGYRHNMIRIPECPAGEPFEAPSL